MRDRRQRTFLAAEWRNLAILPRSDPSLHPELEGLEQIVVRVDHRAVVGGPAVAERVDARSTAAMRHPGHHEDPVEIADVAHGPLALAVVVESVLGSDGGRREENKL